MSKSSRNQCLMWIAAAVLYAGYFIGDRLTAYPASEGMRVAYRSYEPAVVPDDGHGQWYLHLSSGSDHLALAVTAEESAATKDGVLIWLPGYRGGWSGKFLGRSEKPWYSDK